MVLRSGLPAQEMSDWKLRAVELSKTKPYLPLRGRLSKTKPYLPLRGRRSLHIAVSCVQNEAGITGITTGITSITSITGLPYYRIPSWYYQYYQYYQYYHCFKATFGHFLCPQGASRPDLRTTLRNGERGDKDGRAPFTPIFRVSITPKSNW